MRSFIEECIDVALGSGADYADVRVVDTDTESISIRTGTLEGIDHARSMGYGIRVLADGAWGFAAARDFDRNAASDTARRAVAVAKAAATVSDHRVVLSEVGRFRDTWSSPCEEDPFEVGTDEKLAMLSEADELLRTEEAVKVSHAHMGFYRIVKHYGSSNGTTVRQTVVESGAGLVAYAVTDGEVLPRSYPNSHGGAWEQAGFEAIRALDLAGNAARVSEEAAALLDADDCPAGETTLIIDGSQLALQVHESIGHPTELDRILGDEAAFAGTSFLGLEDVDRLRYGSDIVNVTADATVPGSLGSFAYDDEGVPAQRDHLIERGILTGVLMSRESAVTLGRTSNGCMRADGWNRIPLIRMTTVSLEPGDVSSGAPATLEDLIADTDEGIYVETNNSWSIDDKRLNFQFATEIGWEIKDGERGRMLKNPNYTGITPRFWDSCDAICGEREWRVWGLPNCGKGEPMQVAHVAHGSSPARFRGVQVGVAR